MVQELPAPCTPPGQCEVPVGKRLLLLASGRAASLPTLRASCGGGGQRAVGLCQVPRSQRCEETLSFPLIETVFALTPPPSGSQVARMRRRHPGIPVYASSPSGGHSSPPRPARRWGGSRALATRLGFPPDPARRLSQGPFPAPSPQRGRTRGTQTSPGKRPPLRAHRLFPGPLPAPTPSAIVAGEVTAHTDPPKPTFLRERHLSLGPSLTHLPSQSPSLRAQTRSNLLRATPRVREGVSYPGLFQKYARDTRSSDA